MKNILFTITLLISFVSFGQTAEEYFQNGANKYEKRVTVFEIQINDNKVYFEGELFTGIVYDIFSNGNIKEVTKYKNGKHNGLRKEWYQNGKYSKWLNYKDGKLDGLWREWFENGTLSSEQSFENGKKNGHSIDFHLNGELLNKCYYYDGIIGDGIFTMYHDDGRKMSEGRYKNGEETGLWKHWYENGTLYKEGRYENGKKIGLWQNWFPNGEKSFTETH